MRQRICPIYFKHNFPNRNLTIVLHLQFELLFEEKIESQGNGTNSLPHPLPYRKWQLNLIVWIFENKGRGKRGIRVLQPGNKFALTLLLLLSSMQFYDQNYSCYIK